jgi:hypothetical protein
MSHASGTFDVKLVPQAMEETPETAGLARMTIDKEFHGDLTGSSKGQMLAGGSVKGSGGYVAMERVTGTLQGRTGSFMLQHSGTMRNGNYQLSIAVVPDTGSGELVGLAGTLKIIIAPDGKHSYEFDYTLETQEKE